MTFYRWFYLEQNIYEFDPVEMVYLCIRLAMKVEEINMDIHKFCKHMNNPKYCNPESNLLL